MVVDEAVGGAIGCCHRMKKMGGGSMGRRRAGRWRWEGKVLVGDVQMGICEGILWGMGG